MKYIRTENGIYEVVDFDNECIIPSPIVKINDRLTHISDYKKWKKADTIEELCDEFVFINVGIYKDKVYRFKTLEESKKCNELYDKCYGAIYTDKGLIYVAKMNYKEEFEILK